MTTMDDRYGDGSDHAVCDGCGMCLDCDDCICDEAKPRIRTVYNALSVERLEELRPDWEEHAANTWRSTKWYNEAPFTAAALFIEAAEENDQFREEFVENETIQVPAFPDGDGDETVPADKWRQTLVEELPEYNEKIDSIGLSAFQGGSAEKMARDRL